MGELTTKKQNLPSKETVGQYVHDMLDLEIRAHSLRQTAKESRRLGNNLVQQAFNNWERSKSNGENILQKVKASEKEVSKISNYRKYYFREMGSNYFILCLSYLLIGCALLVALFFVITSDNFSLDDQEAIMPFGGILFFMFGFIIHSIHSRVKYRKELRSKKQKLEDDKKAYKQAENCIMSAKKEYDEKLNYMSLLQTHANQLETDAAEIENALEKNYSLNIVPPDYRRLECMVWIDYAFRNDQVDTMREATLQCDKWTRHGEMMNVLNELARNFRSIENLLQKINANISMMNQELFRIAEIQEMRLSETQSARYAMESVQKSTEKLAMYEEMKRNGTFINTGRGAQVDEAGMLEALKKRPDVSAILDVTIEEPPTNEDFYRLDNVFLTPHIAGSQGNEVARMSEMVVDQFENLLFGKPTQYEITEKMLATMA